MPVTRSQLRRLHGDAPAKSAAASGQTKATAAAAATEVTDPMPRSSPPVLILDADAIQVLLPVKRKAAALEGDADRPDAAAGGATSAKRAGGGSKAKPKPQKQKVAPAAGAKYPSAKRARLDSNSDGRYDDEEGHYRDVDEGLVLDKRYIVERSLGKGTFAKVVRCYDTKSRSRVAVKVIKNLDSYRQAALAEIATLQVLQESKSEDKKLIIPLDCWFEFRHHICLVFSLLGPSLYDFGRDNNGYPFPLPHIKSIAHQLLRAMRFLHNHKMTHTDIKPENILLVDGRTRTEAIQHKGKTVHARRLLNTEVRLIDMGSATYISNSKHTRVVSTRHYRAPEVILELGWSYACDMWSLGCVFLELYTGETLFQTHENVEHLAMMEACLGPMPNALVNATRKRAYFTSGGALNWPDSDTSNESISFVTEHCHPIQYLQTDQSEEHYQFFSLIKGLLRYDPNQRLTAAKALKHRFFADMEAA